MPRAFFVMCVLTTTVCSTSLADEPLFSGPQVGEELTEGPALGKVIDAWQADLVVIGEASELSLVRAGRGRADAI